MATDEADESIIEQESDSVEMDDSSQDDTVTVNDSASSSPPLHYEVNFF